MFFFLSGPEHTQISMPDRTPCRSPSQNLMPVLLFAEVYTAEVQAALALGRKAHWGHINQAGAKQLKTACVRDTRDKVRKWTQSGKWNRKACSSLHEFTVIKADIRDLSLSLGKSISR